MKKLKKVILKKKTIKKLKPKQKQKHSKKHLKLCKPDKTVAIPVKVTSPVVSDSSTPFPKKRKKKQKNVSKMYFTQETEDSIVLYNKETDLNLRERIFEEKIYYPLQKLVENVLNTFKFSYFETSALDVQKECLTHLVANLSKFDPNRKSKINPLKKSTAYSFFSIIAKNYLIHLNNTNYKKFNQNIELSEDRDENTIQLQQEDKYYAQQEIDDFIKLIIIFWENNVEKIFTKPRDLKIANAVVHLFRNSSNISLYNKKALYLCIRDIANCKTQQITKVINKMKVFHDKMKSSYQNNGIIETTL